MKIYLRLAIASLITLVAIVTSFLVAVPAHADTYNFTWTLPTTREDGTPLTPAEIANFRIKWDFKGVPQTDILAPPTATTYVLTTASPGKVCATIYTIDTDALESLQGTGPVCRKARPSAPGNPKFN